MNHYTVTARHYDAAYEAKQLADLPFYLRFAEEQGGPVLDIGCGTGRVAIPLARKRIDVTAIDASEPMLRIFREKLRAESLEVRSRITIRKADMRKPGLRKRFSTIILPFRAQQHMHTPGDQIAALTSLRKLLAPGGRLAFDVFLPKLERVFSGIEQEIEEMSWKTVEAGKGMTIRRFFVKESADPLNLSFSGRFIYRTFDGFRLVREESDTLKMTCYTYPQLHLLFRIAGLEPVAEYGTFSKGPLRADSPEMIFILRRKAGQIPKPL